MPSLQDRLFCYKQGLGVEWRLPGNQGNKPPELALGLDGFTAAGVLAAPQGEAGNWCPLLEHPIVTSCWEGPMLN